MFSIDRIRTLKSLGRQTLTIPLMMLVFLSFSLGAPALFGQNQDPAQSEPSSSGQKQEAPPEA